MMIIQYDERGGRTLEDAYSGWLKIFQQVAEAPNDTITVVGYPRSWSPLLWYLGEGRHEDMSVHLIPREHVEAHCASEPVLVDALWRADMRWHGPRRHKTEKHFSIATYSGFWRPEVRDYLKLLHGFTPDHRTRKAVIVPCAADKPYPAPMHKAVRRVIPSDYHIIVATSVLGLVPEELWRLAPEYDSGLPYFERVREEAARYFDRMRDHYKHVVNYCDMLQWDIHAALYEILDGALQSPVIFPKRCDYQDLMSEQNLAALKGMCE